MGLGISVPAAVGASWLAGDRIVMGGNGRGPLSAGLSNYPVGAAFVYGSSSPDLFVAAGRFSHEPGLFLYRWIETADGDTPVFAARIKVAHPGAVRGVPPTGTIFQTRNGDIHGFWLIEGEIVRTRFDRARMAFTRLPLPPIATAVPGEQGGVVNPDNRTATRLTVLENPDESLELILSVSDGTRFQPQEPASRRDPAYHAFDGAGIWRGDWPFVHLRAGRLPAPDAEVSVLTQFRRVSSTDQEALLSHGSLTPVNLGAGRERDLIAGSHFGLFYHYRNRSTAGVEFDPHSLVRDPDGRVIRNPVISASPVAYPAGTDGRTGLVVGGEGGLTWYRLIGVAEDGQVRFEEPVPVLLEKALLYTGSLPVVNAVDWDGDGVSDLVVGNSEGNVLFFRNAGSSESPDFRPGVPVRAAGEVIHIQQGYWGIQGPGESRWGYASPTVIDWNGNGLPDLIMSDATARHTVYLNTGTRTEPHLGPARALYVNGLDLHGTWRVRPGVAMMAGRRAYVALDGDDQFRLYWQIDNTHLADGGKLRLDDGSPIGANFLPAGGTGRSKIVLTDWDGDGATDLLVGTPRHGSIPDPKSGLPQSKGLPGSAVLWLRNIGTDAAPVFSRPLLLHVRGQPLYLGQHECSVAVTDLGGPGGPHLLVGDEEGHVHFFNRRDITWQP